MCQCAHCGGQTVPAGMNRIARTGPASSRADHSPMPSSVGVASTVDHEFPVAEGRPVAISQRHPAVAMRHTVPVAEASRDRTQASSEPRQPVDAAVILPIHFSIHTPGIRSIRPQRRSRSVRQPAAQCVRRAAMRIPPMAAVAAQTAMDIANLA